MALLLRPLRLPQRMRLPLSDQWQMRKTPLPLAQRALDQRLAPEKKLALLPQKTRRQMRL